jgi:hypothetical protein
MSEPQTLLDRQALADVMSHYASAIDERDVDRYRGLFTPEVEIVGFAREPIHGVDAWIEFVLKTLDRFESTQHMLGPQLVTQSGDRADCRTDLRAVHLNKEPKGTIFTLWGTYLTRMVRSPAALAGWQIERHELVVRGTQNS